MDNEKVPEKLDWAIYSDLSGVANVGCGAFATEAEANERLIQRLEAEREEIAAKLARAKRRRRALAARKEDSHAG